MPLDVPKLATHQHIRNRFGKRAETLGGDDYTWTEIRADDTEKDDVCVTFVAMQDVADRHAPPTTYLKARYRHGGEEILINVESMSIYTALGLLGVFVRQEGY